MSWAQKGFCFRLVCKSCNADYQFTEWRLLEGCDCGDSLFQTQRPKHWYPPVVPGSPRHKQSILEAAARGSARAAKKKTK